jgi:ABC-type uncharacterized transport system substrate-binding protein
LNGASFTAYPIELGLVTSLNRPGGNVTGVGAMSAEVGAKRLGILHELLPSASRFSALVNPNDANAQPVIRDLQAAASTIGRQVEILNANTRHDIDVAFVNLMKRRTDAPRRKASSSTVASKSSLKQRATRCPQSIRRANLPRLAD